MGGTTQSKTCPICEAIPHTFRQPTCPHSGAEREAAVKAKAASTVTRAAESPTNGEASQAVETMPQASSAKSPINGRGVTGSGPTEPVRRALCLPKTADGNTLLVLPEARHVPSELVTEKRWVIWKAEWNGKKWAKPPRSPRTNEKIGPSMEWSAHFTDFETAIAGADRFDASGIGLMFFKPDGRVAIDFDHCITVVTEDHDIPGGHITSTSPAINPQVWNWLGKWFSTTYQEISPSGDGIHVLCLGELAKAVKKPDAFGEGVGAELYHDGRFMTFTAQSFYGHPLTVTDRQESINKLVDYLGGDKTAAAGPQVAVDLEKEVALADAVLKGTEKITFEELLPHLALIFKCDPVKYHLRRKDLGEHYKIGLKALDKFIFTFTPPEENDKHYDPMTKRTARKIHQDNLTALRRAIQGEGNGLLNSTAFFAGRAFAAGALESADQLQDEMFDIVTKEWRSPHPQHGARSTIQSGWNAGVAKPLQIREENPAERSVTEFNEDHFVILDYGSKCRVGYMEEEDQEELKGRLKLRLQSPEEFTKGRDYQTVVGARGEIVGRASHWFKHPDRRTYQKVVFKPEQKVPSNHYNLWRGWAFEPKKGDCSKYLDHLQNIICSGNAECYDYLSKWMARAVQKPWERGHVAIGLRSEEGTGKNIMIDGFGKSFGAHYMMITNANHLVGRFNAHLRAKCVINANEAFYAGNKEHGDTLKSLVTDETLPIEQKFVDAETDANIIHLFVLSNHDWVVPVGIKGRRFFMLDVNEAKIGDFKYFAAIKNELDHGGHEALLWHLKYEVDISNFNVRYFPKTAAMRSQQARTLVGIEAAWYECLLNGELPGGHVKDGETWLQGSEFVAWAADHARKQGLRNWLSDGGLSTTKLGLLFGENHGKGMGFTNKQTRLFNDRNRYWEIPTLAKARKLWSEKRFPEAWDENQGWEVVRVKD